MLATHPVYFPIDAAVAATASRLSLFDRKAFTATEVASTVWVTMSVVWWRRRWPNPGGVSPSVCRWPCWQPASSFGPDSCRPIGRWIGGARRARGMRSGDSDRR